MIKEIKIENFKSIRELTLELKPINILIGPNGAGKSNFVDFFGLVYAINDKQLREYIANKAGASKLLYLGLKNSNHLLGSLIFQSVNKDILESYKFILKPNEQDGLYFAKELTGYKNIQDSSFPSNWGWRDFEHGVGHVESNLTGENFKNALVVYLESFRVYHFHDTSKTAPLKKTARLADDRYLRNDGENLAAFLFGLQIEAPLAFNRIEATIKLVAPYFDRFDLVPNGDFIRLKWRQNNTDMYLDASDLSDGTLRFIALCTLFLQPNLPETIIVDEPELGLHPYAINILAGLMKNASEKSQIIISTQSVSLIDNFEPEDIIVVNNTANESHFKRLSSEELDIWLAEYSLGELWNKNVLGGNP
ncbi:AAA family ATPase [Larkinella sp. VNQ87]|uniref:AAA family ATPase n=1 Tax=Larkinella sp. VNQ87 TaxID=3400921 RepID=UPI003C05AEA0